jgi:hypothetical protein
MHSAIPAIELLHHVYPSHDPPPNVDSTQNIRRVRLARSKRTEFRTC